ncbi:GNAT family N-acetyltransferase [Actinomyces trachealis]|uniref:GNAT family N-acetyltransferase n=1 Tax=Actinomyces trachealis TaxID=2763540 RepID=UPI001892A70E|nr:GNAT family N-acetyltransferase [Actinomyces trachealis]
MSEPVAIRPGGPADLDVVVGLLTDVFLIDPLMSTIAAAAPSPRTALEHLHRVELADRYLSADAARRAGSVVDLAVGIGSDGEERVLGVALWDAPVPPGAQGDPAGPLGPGDAPPAGLDHALLGNAWGLVLLDGAQCEAARPEQPHWYLYMVAVAPQARGSGTGTALLRHGLERVDAGDDVAHLESTSPGSRRLYERLGFRQVAVLDHEPLPVYWAMTRPAHPAHPAHPSGRG